MPTVSLRELEIENKQLKKIFAEQQLQLETAQKRQQNIEKKIQTQDKIIISLNIKITEKEQETTQENKRQQDLFDKLYEEVVNTRQLLEKEQLFYNENQEILEISAKIELKKEQLLAKIDNIYEQIELNYDLQKDYDQINEIKTADIEKEKIRTIQFQNLAGLHSRELLVKDVEIKENQQKCDSYLNFDYL